MGYSRDLHQATVNGNTELVTRLLRGRCDPNGFGSQDHPPLVWAARGGHTSCIEVLLKGRASIDQPDSRGGWTALFYAASFGAEAAVRTLCAGGARVQCEDSDGGTSLFHVANSDCARALLDWRCSVDHRDVARRTPLFLAAWRNDTVLTSFMLDQRCDVNAVDACGRSALFFAAYSGSDACSQLLLERHGHADLIDCYGRTPLTYAASAGREGVLRLLCLCSQSGVAGVSAFEGVDHAEIVRRRRVQQSANRVFHAGVGSPLLLLLGAGNAALQDDVKQEEGEEDAATAASGMPVESLQAEDPLTLQTPLFHAAARGNVSHVLHLLQGLSDPNHTDAAGQSALYLAAESGHNCCIGILLDHCCDTDCHDNQGRTPLCVAKGNVQAEFLQRRAGGTAPASCEAPPPSVSVLPLGLEQRPERSALSGMSHDAVTSGKGSKRSATNALEEKSETLKTSRGCAAVDHLMASPSGQQPAGDKKSACPSGIEESAVYRLVLHDPHSGQRLDCRSLAYRAVLQQIKKCLAV